MKEEESHLLDLWCRSFLYLDWSGSNPPSSAPYTAHEGVTAM